MTDAAKQEREARIEAAAYALLAEHGYGGTTMLKVAKAARASNETLYRWYGDKVGLFTALVARNADSARQVLEDGLSGDHPPIQMLEKLGPTLLDLLLGDRAIALNRAAAADPSGELGAAIGAAGRQTVMPMISDLLDKARGRGDLAFASPPEAAELYISLLVGDCQIRRVIGVLPAQSPEQIKARAERALRQFCDLLAPKGA